MRKARSTGKVYTRLIDTKAKLKHASKSKIVAEATGDVVIPVVVRRLWTGRRSMVVGPPRGPPSRLGRVH
jgi:hypothetical protein